MPTKPPEICDLAERLAKGQQQPAELEVTRRTVHSRAYYSAYHTIVKAAAKARNFPKLECDHDKLIQYLENDCQDNGLREVGGNLKTLKDARKVADYKLDEAVRDQSTGLYLSLARKIIKSTNAIHDALKLEKKAPPDRNGRPVP